MIDLHSPSTPLTIHLPGDLIAALQALARQRQSSVDEVVQEACLAYAEPALWERCYQEWARTHPGQR